VHAYATPYETERSAAGHPRSSDAVAAHPLRAFMNSRRRTPADADGAALVVAAIRLACDVHERQRDRAGAAYILHPLRVGLRGESLDEMLAGILHDVVEDGDVTLADLRRAGFPPSVVRLVDALSHRDGESYEAYIRRASRNPVAARIKLRDLEDNLDLLRYELIHPRDVERFNRYLHAHRTITASLAARLRTAARRPARPTRKARSG
jgi:(p)ppGpp synthase/HD superfamily hydrolase